MSTIITTATVMAMYLNAAGSINSQYAYNADIENNQVKTMYVMNKSGNSLSSKLKYAYSYDAEGRLSSKTASLYNSRTGKYVPAFRLDFSYTTDGYAIERSTWNSHSKNFNRPDCRTEYHHEVSQVLAVTTYEWSNAEDKMLPVDNILVMTPAYEYLLADQL